MLKWSKKLVEKTSSFLVILWRSFKNWDAKGEALKIYHYYSRFFSNRLHHILRHHYRYNPSSYISNSAELREALDQIKSGFYCQEEPDRFKDLCQDLTTKDYFMLCADFAKYMAAQAAADEAYRARYILSDIYLFTYF